MVELPGAAPARNERDEANVQRSAVDVPGDQNDHGLATITWIGGINHSPVGADAATVAPSEAGAVAAASGGQREKGPTTGARHASESKIGAENAANDESPVAAAGA